MKGIVLKKIIHIFVVLIGVSILTFVLGRIAPGDPSLTLLDNGSTMPSEEEIQEARQFLGLDKPVAVQYGLWLWKAVNGDFGLSYKTGLPAMREILIRLPATIELACGAFAVLIIVSSAVGISAALNQGNVIGKILNIFSISLLSVPSFCIGIMLMIFLGVNLKLLPTMGSGSIIHLIMPAITLGLSMSAGFMRFIKVQIAEELEKEYVYSQKAMGVKYYKIILNNVIPNSLTPIVTNLGIAIGGLLGGSAIVETIFAWPGTGSYMIESIQARDYPVMQCYALIMAAIYIIVNSIVDISYMFLDPRIKLGEYDI